MGQLTKIEEIEMGEQQLEMTLDDVPISVGGGDFPVVDPGAYPAVLSTVKPAMKKKFQSEEEELVLSFKYQIMSDAGEVFVYRDVRPGTGDRSNLTKDMNAICRADYEKVRDSQEGVRELIKTLIGKPFLITVDLVTSKKGRQYNKFMAVTTLPKGMAIPQGTKGDEDNIPF